MPRDDVLVPDGGLSGAPEDRRHDLASDLWTNRPLRDDFQTAAAHRTYYLAGAAVATTASYQTSDDLARGARSSTAVLAKRTVCVSWSPTTLPGSRPRSAISARSLRTT